MRNIWTILHQLTEYWIQLDSLIVGGKKLLGFKTTKFFLIQFVQPLCHTSAAWIALFACAMLMPQNSLLRNNMHFWLALRLHQKNQSIIKHFNEPTKEFIMQNPDRLVERKRNQKRREQESEQKPKPNCPVNSKSSRIPSPSSSAYSQNQKDYDRRLETTVQLSIVIKDLKA